MTVAWLLESNGVTPLIAVRRSVWPGAATVTREDGSTATVHVDNVLAPDDLGRRFW